MFYAFYLMIKSRGHILSNNISPTARIGKNLKMRRGGAIGDKAIVGDNCLFYKNVVIGPKVEVGCYTSINNGTIIENGIIGKACSIGVDCIIGPGIHTMSYITTSAHLYKNRYLQPHLTTIVKNDVWIGSRSIIMQGVKIGNGAVIGAGAVVTKDVPPYAVVVGVPARIIKYRFDKEIIKKLEERMIWNGFPTNMNEIDELIQRKTQFIDYL